MIPQCKGRLTGPPRGLPCVRTTTHPSGYCWQHRSQEENPVMDRPPIRRNGTFEYKGVRYKAMRLGPYASADNAWEVYRVHDGWSAGEFRRMADIRALLDRAVREDWPSLIEEETDA